jgi:hypothetical protein
VGGWWILGVVMVVHLTMTATLSVAVARLIGNQD